MIRTGLTGKLDERFCAITELRYRVALKQRTSKEMALGRLNLNMFIFQENVNGQDLYFAPCGSGIKKRGACGKGGALGQRITLFNTSY